MSEKPQEARGEPEDLLEQIITQGLEKIPAPAQTAARPAAPPDSASPAPRQEHGEGDAPPAGSRNRRSAVYLYLLILFGAAFLMLLLAYFVQRRSSENTISDLRDFMNLSRAELLEQIEELEDQNAALAGEVDRLSGELGQWQQRYEEKAQEAGDLSYYYYSAQSDLYSLSSFLQLERYYQAGEYESCAAILLLQRQGQYAYHTPDGAEQRYEEIVKAVINAGILDEHYLLHPENYEDLLIAYFERLGVSVEAAQWPDTVQWSATAAG